jgi:hypothetical protein
METKKTIYDLNEHESMLITIGEVGPESINNYYLYPYVWQVTRVATGWIYQNANLIRQAEGYFVPLTSLFKS